MCITNDLVLSTYFRRMLDTMNAKGEKPRKAAYVDLLKITGGEEGQRRDRHLLYKVIKIFV
jgi:hypothetical protein